jgi:hypothetical protein
VWSSGDDRWAFSGFQQLMTTATQSVISQVNKKQGKNEDPNFSIAYLPMNTGEFSINSSAKYTLMVYMLIIVLIYPMIGSIRRVAQEDHEI